MPANEIILEHIDVKPYDGEKRTYLPWKLSAPCRRCGRVLVRDMRDNHLSYPRFEGPTTIDLYCEDTSDGEPCEGEVEVRVIISVQIDLLDQEDPDASE